MLVKILKKDLQNKKIISVVLFVFILLAALSLSSSSVIIVQLVNSLDTLFESAEIPDFVQMHAGEIDQPQIDAFTAGQPNVAAQQSVKMLTIDGSDLFIGNTNMSEKNSVIDVSFVKQNDSFDYLLSQSNEILELSQGEIGVPVFYIEKSGLEIGAPVILRTDAGEVHFTVVEFIRDAQMNPSLVSSKRFLISDADYEMLEPIIAEYEYLIEFQLVDSEMISEFSNAYQNSNLPDKGPAVDYGIFQQLNLITDGLVSLIVMVISLLLTVIALISLRFSILSSLEDEVREIGVMKAIGFAHKDIRNIFLVKYLLLAILGCSAGYGLSLLLSDVLAANMHLYMGAGEITAMFYLIPFIAAVIIFAVVVASCVILLKRLKKISAVSAIRNGNIQSKTRTKHRFSLHSSRLLNVNLYLGFKDIFSRTKIYWLLLLVFIVCSFVMVLPVNLFNTINDESFSAYMGVEESDIRIDLHQTEDMASRYDEITTYLENDPVVEKFGTLITCRYKVLNNEGGWENINITTGELNAFSLSYLEGNAPSNEHEIALSYLNASEMDKSLGDEITLDVNGEEMQLTVSGIYQDVTNGGKTAKAAIPVNEKTILWYVINIDVIDTTSLQAKIQEYSAKFSQAKVTDLRDYVLQTFGDTLSQINVVKWVTILAACFMACLIASLFLRMLTAKDRTQIAIMKNIGFCAADITMQYIAKTLIVLVSGIIIGMLLCNTVGEVFVSAVAGMAGAPSIHFAIHPLEVYVIYPLVLIGITILTTSINCLPIKQNTTTTEMFE